MRMLLLLTLVSFLWSLCGFFGGLSNYLVVQVREWLGSYLPSQGFFLRSQTPIVLILPLTVLTEVQWTACTQALQGKVWLRQVNCLISLALLIVVKFAYLRLLGSKLFLIVAPLGKLERFLFRGRIVAAIHCLIVCWRCRCRNLWL